MAPPLANSLIGLLLSNRFRVKEKTGEEVLGSLYLAIDEHPDSQGRSVVVKVLHPHLTGNKEKFARFAREITATDMVKHPNTVGVVGWGQHLELHFLVLEHYLCHPLSEELERGAMAPERAAHIAAQIAAAVGAAHQEGVVHRNLSLHNILLLDNAANGDFIKVRDFGLSKLEQVDTDDTGAHLTQVGARVGNSHYMAPEYIEEGTVHPKGDLYAVGGLFFHMVTGQPPYPGRAADVLTAHIADPIPAPRRVRPELPEWCDDFVEALMAKTPKERPGGYEAVRLLEEGVGHSLAAPALLKVRVDGTIERPKRTGLGMAMVLGVGMLTLAVVTLVVLLVGAVGAGAYTLATRPPPPEGLEPVAAPAPAVAPAAAVPPPTPTAAPKKARSQPKRGSPAKPAPAQEPEPVKVGKLEVTATDRALVYIDEEVAGYTPIVLSASEGPHVIRVVLPGQASSEQRRDVRFTPTTRETIRITF